MANKAAAVEVWPIGKLKLWASNPRSITETRFTQLKDSITQLGFNDVLKVTKDGTVIGGNMRLRALQALGYAEVPVIVTNATTEQDMFRIALRDNEEFGYYEPEQVAELAARLDIPALELQSYELALAKPVALSQVMADLGMSPEVSLDNSDEPEFQQVTFTLHKEQLEVLQQAIAKAKEINDFRDSQNLNSNGNAIFAIAEGYLNGVG